VVNPDGSAGILGLAMTNFDNDNVPEVTFFTDIDGHLITADSQTGQVDWQSDYLEAPFNGYTLYATSASSADDRRNIMALETSMEIGGWNGNGGGVVFGLDFDTKEEIWRTASPATMSVVQDLLAGDLDGDGTVEVITFGSYLAHGFGLIHVLDGLTGTIRAVFRKVSTLNEVKKAYSKTLIMLEFQI
jgi:outer membrane protein assembly factor BamB